MRIIFMGTPPFAVPALQGLVRAGYKVVSVFTQPDRPSGRGRKLVPSAVKLAARELGLMIAEPKSLKKPEVLDELKELAADVIVVCAYARILPPKVLALPRLGCLNIHPSLLPRHRGASPVTAAIISGDEFSGVSIMRMDAGLDTGAVLSQVQIPISAEDTTGVLTEKLSLIAASQLVEVLPQWSKGRIVPRSQNEREASYSSVLTKEMGYLDWQLGADELWRKVRAFQPWPGAYTFWNGSMLKIIKSAALPSVNIKVPGTIVKLAGRQVPFGVVCGSGVLGISNLQLAGKRALNANEFINGKAGFIGSRLG